MKPLFHLASFLESFALSSFLIYPHHESIWEIGGDVIDKSDILLEILDSRLIGETRNPEIEEKGKASGKTFDLCSKQVRPGLDKEVSLEKKAQNYHSVCVCFLNQERWHNNAFARDQKYCDKAEKDYCRGFGRSKYREKLCDKRIGRQGVCSLFRPKAALQKQWQLIKVTKIIFLLDTPGVYSTWKRISTSTQ